jgi:hypothetical protein
MITIALISQHKQKTGVEYCFHTELLDLELQPYTESISLQRISSPSSEMFG